MANDGKFLEEVVYNRFKSLSNEIITDDEGNFCEEIVKYNVWKHYPVFDYKAKKNRYIDVALIYPDGRLLAVECKDHTRKKDEGDVDKFFSLMLFANANKGLIISSSGFTKDAVTKAHNLPGMEVETMTLEEFEYCSTLDYNYYNACCPVCENGFIDFRDFSNVISSEGKYFKIFHGICYDCFTIVYLKQYHTKTVITPVLNIDEEARQLAVTREVSCGDNSGFTYVVNSDASVSFKYKGKYCEVHSYGQA